MGHFPSWAEGTLIEYNQCHQPANETQSGGAIRDILQGKRQLQETFQISRGEKAGELEC